MVVPDPARYDIIESKGRRVAVRLPVWQGFYRDIRQRQRMCARRIAQLTGAPRDQTPLPVMSSLGEFRICCLRERLRKPPLGETRAGCGRVLPRAVYSGRPQPDASRPTLGMKKQAIPDVVVEVVEDDENSAGRHRHGSNHNPHQLTSEVGATTSAMSVMCPLPVPALSDSGYAVPFHARAHADAYAHVHAHESERRMSWRIHPAMPASESRSSGTPSFSHGWGERGKTKTNIKIKAKDNAPVRFKPRSGGSSHTHLSRPSCNSAVPMRAHHSRAAPSGREPRNYYYQHHGHPGMAIGDPGLRLGGGSNWGAGGSNTRQSNPKSQRIIDPSKHGLLRSVPGVDGGGRAVSRTPKTVHRASIAPQNHLMTSSSFIASPSTVKKTEAAKPKSKASGIESIFGFLTVRKSNMDKRLAKSE